MSLFELKFSKPTHHIPKNDTPINKSKYALDLFVLIDILLVFDVNLIQVQKKCANNKDYDG